MTHSSISPEIFSSDWAIPISASNTIDDAEEFTFYSSNMNPFGELGVDLSTEELRETAYEILIGVCRSSGNGRRLNYVSNSSLKERSFKLSALPSVKRSVSTSGESEVREALNLKHGKNSRVEGDCGNLETRGGADAGELMRVQMRVSEQINTRVRRGLLRVAAGQLGKRIESMVLPLELLKQVKPSDFPTQEEHDACLRRYLKLLEAGLLIHPNLPLDKSLTTTQRLRQILYLASEKPTEMLKHSESVDMLCRLVNSLACRSFDGSVTDICHWADGIPLNLHLYTILLEACFGRDDEAFIIDEFDEILEQVKKTWAVLGMDQKFHNLCYFWILFNQYTNIGESKDDLLFAAHRMMVEMEKDAYSTIDPAYSKILSSILDVIADWAQKRLLRYHDTFYRGNIDVMQVVLSLGVSAAKMMSGMTSEHGRNEKEVVARHQVEGYIRSSLCNAFIKEKEKAVSSKKSSKTHGSPLHVLSILAQNICDLAFNEKEIYSPVLKRWHPVATGVAVATLHACYANELKRFVTATSELNPEAIQVLLAAERLEKDLVQMAVADAVDSEDGGKAIIKEMPPYEADTVINNLVKSWIQTRIDRLGEWVDRIIQKEDWKKQVNKGRVAPSSVEVLRFIDEAMEAFFLLPIPKHPVLLPELMMGLDKCIQKYIIQAASGCGSRLTYITTLPPLTRCTTGSKLSPFKRKDRSLNGSDKKSQVHLRNDDDPLSSPRLCLRINTFYSILKELETVEKRTISNLKNIGYAEDESVAKGKFMLSASSCNDGIRQLSEVVAYKIVFRDLSHVLSDYLYVGEVSSSRIEPFLEELEQNLELISSTVHDRVRTRVITNVMKASFEGFILVLLAGGPSRAFTLQDVKIIEEDFKLLSDLFWSNGDGLPADLIIKLSDTVTGVLSLFGTATEDLIMQCKSMTIDSHGGSAHSRLPLPSRTAQWSPTDLNTILHVLCHRIDKVSSRFLKKTYGLPKKI